MSGRHFADESWLERDAAMLLDFDPALSGCAPQPFCLFWWHLTKMRGRQGVPSCLGHVQAYQTMSSSRALSAMLKSQ
jgi:hypothetical protein